MADPASAGHVLRGGHAGEDFGIGTVGKARSEAVVKQRFATSSQRASNVKRVIASDRRAQGMARTGGQTQALRGCGETGHQLWCCPWVNPKGATEAAKANGKGMTGKGKRMERKGQAGLGGRRRR